MTVLTPDERKAIPKSDFALPGRRYPIQDRVHAANALARVAQYGTPEEKAKVQAAVFKRYPGLDEEAGETQAHEDAESPAVEAVEAAEDEVCK